MFWIVGWAAITLVGVCGTVASINSARFGRRVAHEMAALATAAEPGLLDRERLTDLPAPVARYARKAIARPTAIRLVHLRHRGRFRPSLEGSWVPIRGEQLFRTDAPAFVWWGRVRMAPGIWIDARDRFADGAGNMLVVAESTLTLANRVGPQLDQGALARLLGEMTWCPTALLDSRYVRWSPVDNRRASATLRVGDTEATGTFEFGPDDLPVSFASDRFRDLGGGRAVLTPFVGRYADYRRVGGVLVPHRMSAAWVIDNGPLEYVDFVVDAIEIDPARF